MITTRLLRHPIKCVNVFKSVLCCCCKERDEDESIILHNIHHHIEADQPAVLTTSTTVTLNPPRSTFTMIGNIVRRSSLNSFSSICYCLVTLGVHSYASYVAISRYKMSEERAWPGSKDTPVESRILLAMAILSLTLMPVFIVACCFRIGNFANDGVKLGRDHALGAAIGGKDGKAGPSPTSRARRVWRHLCPVGPTVHLVAAFLLLLPGVLLRAVEVRHQYASTDTSWSSEVDFLFSPERSFLSDARALINLTDVTRNSTHVVLPSGHVVDWRQNHASVSIAFANLTLALAAFLIRYASVFWFTNKGLTVVLALQLLAMITNSVFSFNCFSVLYCVCYNQDLYLNVNLSVACSADLILYLIGSFILLISTVLVFEYGVQYFHEKFKIIERHHNPEIFVKQTVVVNSGCQGYIPHVGAMAAFILFAVCKGPLLYDMVSLMRLTEDKLLTMGVVCEVSYMVTWVALWFGLTIKQQWQFRILDFVPLRQRLKESSAVVDCNSSDKSGQHGRGDMVNVADFIRNKRIASINEHPQHRYSDPLPAMYGDEANHSELGTDESDMGNGADIVYDLDGNPTREYTGPNRRSNHRRPGAQRVTFEASGHRRGSPERQTSSLPRNATYNHSPDDDTNINVRAEVHNSSSHTRLNIRLSSQNIHSGGPSTPVSEHKNSRELRSSLKVRRGGDTYSSSSNIGDSFDEAAPLPDPMEPLPTLMSSFRDKVRESSLAANNLREREKIMLDKFNNYSDTSHLTHDHNPHDVHQSQNHNPHDAAMSDVDKRRCIAISDNDDVTHHKLGSSRELDTIHTRHNSAHENTIYGRDVSLFPNGNHSSHGDLHKHSGYNLQQNGNISTIEDKVLPRNISHHVIDQQTELPAVLDRGYHDNNRKELLRVPSGKGNPRNDVMVGGGTPRALMPRPLHVVVEKGKKAEIGRRDSANYSLTSSQDTSSNESDHGQGLCSQV